MQHANRFHFFSVCVSGQCRLHVAVVKLFSGNKCKMIALMLKFTREGSLHVAVVKLFA